MPKSWIARGAETAERMRRLIHDRGFTPNGHPTWKPPEEGDLRDSVPDYKAARKKITQRTTPACYSKASRLKITRPRSLLWSENELLRLRKIYPTGTREEILAAFPGRTWAAIATKANSRGIYRAPKPYKPTGNRVLDQILERARAHNVSMEDLDGEVRGKRYFSQRKWRGGRFDHAIHFRAVAYLGGTLRTTWKSGPHLSHRLLRQHRRQGDKAVAA